MSKGYQFEQIVKVKSDEWDGDESGHHWQTHYVLYQTNDDLDGNGHECFDLYDDDGEGNGDMIARGYNKSQMVHLTLKLGEFVEWKQGVPVRTSAAIPPSHRQTDVLGEIETDDGSRKVTVRVLPDGTLGVG